MKIPALASVLIVALLAGCEKQTAAPEPAPAPKSQEVIFDAQSISCKGSSSCDAYVLMYQAKCAGMSTSLQTRMSAGWRVVSSSPKEKVIDTGDGALACVGTEYIIEK